MLQNPTPTDDIQKLLDDPNSKMEDILNHESCYSLYAENFLPLIQYFTLNHKELLNLAIFSENHIIQVRAFSIINLHNQVFLETIIQTHALSSIIEEQITSEKPNGLVLDRLFYILEICIEILFDELKGQLWYLNNSLSLLNHQSVLSFYEYAFQTDNGEKIVQYLIDIDFFSLLITEIEKISFPDYDPDLASGLYELLRLLLKFKSISSRFESSQSRIYSVITPPTGAPIYVIDQYSFMLVDLSTEFSLPFIVSSLDFLFTKIPPFIHQYQISGFEIAAKLFKIPDISYDLSKIIDFAFDIFFEQTNHSLALLGASKLLEEAIKSSAFSKIVINRFLIMADYVLGSSDNHILRPFILNLLRKISDSCPNWENLDKQLHDKLMQTYVVPYEDTCLNLMDLVI